MWAFRQLSAERGYTPTGPLKIIRAEIISFCEWNNFTDDREFCETLFAHIAGLDTAWLKLAYDKINRDNKKNKRLSDGNKSKQLREKAPRVRG